MLIILNWNYIEIFKLTENNAKLLQYEILALLSLVKLLSLLEY